MQGELGHLLEDIKEEWRPVSERAEILGDWLGVDVGFIYPAVDSDGYIYRWSRGSERHSRKHYTVAGPVTIKRRDGSVLEYPAYAPEQLNDVLARARDEDYATRLRHIALEIVGRARDTNRGIVLEDWRDFQKRRSPWTDVYKKAQWCAKEQGISVRTVKRAYTSQTCPECGHVAKGNRPDRDHFKCLRCGHTGQADEVAARNLKAKAEADDVLQRIAGKCKNKACDQASWRTGLCRSCYFYRRRYHVMPSVEKLDVLQAARTYQEFQRRLLLDEMRAQGDRYRDPRIGRTQKSLEERSHKANLRIASEKERAQVGKYENRCYVCFEWFRTDQKHKVICSQECLLDDY